MRGATYRVPAGDGGGSAQLAPSLFAFDLEPAAATCVRPMPTDLAPESGVDGDIFALSGARAVRRELRKGSTKFSRRSMSSTMSKSVRHRIQRGKTDHRAYVRKLARVAREAVALLPHIVAAAESSAVAAEADAVVAAATCQAQADMKKRTSKMGFLRSMSLLDTSRASFVAREAADEVAAKQQVLASVAEAAVDVARCAALAAAEAVALPPHVLVANFATLVAAAAAEAALLSAANADKVNASRLPVACHANPSHNNYLTRPPNIFMVTRCQGDRLHSVRDGEARRGGEEAEQSAERRVAAATGPQPTEARRRPWRGPTASEQPQHC